MTLAEQMRDVGERALRASRELLLLSSRRKNAILAGMADALEARKPEILAANARDLERGRAAGLSPAMLDRLALNDARMAAMARGLRLLADLKDPVGTRLARWIRPNGLEIVKRRVPIGVIAVIYESRPNVTADTAGLCLKASNAVILRGGKEAIESNAAIADALAEGGKARGLPADALQLVRTTEREAVRELVRLEGLVDLVIPRGGEGLVRAVTEHATVPVLKHYKGVCHLFVDQSADLAMALRLAENAKCQRPGVCNAIEKLLIHEKAAAVFLPMLQRRLGEELGVELRGCEAARRIVPGMKPAVEADWTEEYLALVLAVKIVPSVEAAVEHINRHGSRHSDAIVTEDERAARLFSQQVDSSAVFVNASTRFNDGGEFGMGAEIGISTDKLHARGPMGIEELTTYKYVVTGNGQVRE
jgi:glutamate-5-semialdehyde dehydrogenase